MKKITVMSMVREHQNKMIKEAHSIEKKIASLQAENERLWKEIQSMTSLVQGLEELPAIRSPVV